MHYFNTNIFGRFIGFTFSNLKIVEKNLLKIKILWYSISRILWTRSSKEERSAHNRSVAVSGSAGSTNGEMAERSKAAVLKTVDLRGSGGSNPPCSVYKVRHFCHMAEFGVVTERPKVAPC